jgi:VWFA-related protein
MTRPGRALTVALSIALGAPLGAAPESEPPKDVGLMERTSARLAQIDVTVSGPKDAIAGLTAADFEVRLNDKLVRNVIVDALCSETGASRAAATPAPTDAPAAEAPATASSPPAVPAVPSERASTVSYLLYFDQPHLTQAGRRASIDAAREMMPKLMAGGNRAMVVSNAKSLKVLVPLTEDESKIDAALATMIGDVTDFDPFAMTEENRLAEVIGEIDNRLDRALALAKRYAQEERSRQERDLNRLRMVIGRLAEVDPPKAVLYFADNMRGNAGEHYLSFFSSSVLSDPNGVPTSAAADVQLAASTGALPLDGVINEASADGVRFYTVEGQGLLGPTTFIQAKNAGMVKHGSAGVLLSTQRIKDSQATLVTMAAETGGRHFLNGITPAKMSAQILDDLSCVYLLSFDPRGWPEDKPLAVSVVVKRPKVKATARGRLVIQSDSSRLTARVLSAYAAPTANASPVNLRIGLIPVGYEKGRYQARVQVSVPPSRIPGTTWDLGASLVSNGAVVQAGSGRVSVANPGVPVVWEKDMEFSPGDYELVAVAHETTTDELAQRELTGAWPRIDDELAFVAPIAVSQPAKGGFLRDGNAKTSGALVIPEGELLRGDLPTALITLVCRAKDEKKPLHVERTLIGETETPVGKDDIDMGQDRCAQVRDLIPRKTLGPGSYRFVVDVSSGGTDLTRTERKFVVPDLTAPAGVPAAASPAPSAAPAPAGVPAADPPSPSPPPHAP